MKIREISDSTSKDFIAVNVKINKDEPNYIRPLNKDINEVFDIDKNKYLKKGKVIRWVLEDDSGNLIGRIAAFVNVRYKNKGDKLKVGGFGFFDCIDDQEAANLLFDASKEWLKSEGMEAMDGPINMGERDRWWGLMIEGFHPPQYGLNWNQPYYQSLFENYGFQNFYNMICWKMFLPETDQLSEKFYNAFDKYDQNPEYNALHYQKNQLEKFAKDFCAIYNDAWASHGGNKAMAESAAIKTFQAIKPIVEEKLVWFIYHNDKPVAFWFNLPDINEFVKHLNGRFDLFGKAKFLFLRMQKKITGFTGIAFGVIPEYQGKGVDYYMIVSGEREIKRSTKFRNLELHWQGDFNPKMLNISKNMGAKKARTLSVYRYNFDRHLPFERHPII
ncbi:MAG: hypothetical protein GY816_21420 [Cytophagales bacterium]|nr:hypothetical protein [Cytophagales bacterium]